MKKNRIFFALMVSVLFLMQGCYYDNFQEIHPSISTACDSASATYGNQVSKILNAYCLSCHSGSSAGGGILLDNYDHVKSQASSGLLMNALKGNGVPSMPLNSHIDDCKIGSINHWIQSGMPNN